MFAFSTGNCQFVALGNKSGLTDVADMFFLYIQTLYGKHIHSLHVLTFDLLVSGVHKLPTLLVGCCRFGAHGEYGILDRTAYAGNKVYPGKIKPLRRLDY